MISRISPNAITIFFQVSLLLKMMVTDRDIVGPELVVLALTRLIDFWIEKRKEVSVPDYDPNRGMLNPRELYADIHFNSAATKIAIRFQ